MTGKLDLINLHKNIYTHMKKKALSHEGELSDELLQYRKDQIRFSKRPFKSSSVAKLLQAVKISKIVYLGDFHTFDQASRNLERLLRALVKMNNKLTLGVEFVHEQNQNIIDDFLDNKISEVEFLESVDYRESWRFPWNHYKIFFDIARKYSLKVIALNSDGTLAQRDKMASRLITNHLKNHSSDILLVLFGEYHIVPDKLPLQTTIMLGTSIRQTIIHQNLDEVYWKQNKDGNKKGQIICFSESEFSLQSSPPWIKYESMNYWYENLLDDPEFDVHESIMETGSKTLSSTTNETFLYFSKRIRDTLKLEIDEHELEDFNLYDYTKLEYTLNKLKKIGNKPVVNFYQKLVKRGKNFKIPFSSDYYCSNYSINRIAYLAGIHVHHIHLKKIDPEYEKNISNKNQTHRFIFFLYRHFMAYFASKIINPYRKCDLYLDIQQKLSSPKTENRKKAYLQLSIDILDQNKSLHELFRGHTLKNLSSSAKLVGYLLGEIFYENFFVHDSSKLDLIDKNIMKAYICEKTFNDLRINLLPDDSYKSEKKRFF